MNKFYKKFIVSASFIITMLLLCSGCFRANVDLTINDDGSVDGHYIIMVSDLLLWGNNLDELKNELMKSDPNANITKVSKDGLTGYDIHVYYPEIEDMTRRNNDFISDGGSGIQRYSSWFVDEYVVDLYFDGGKDLAGMSPSEYVMAQAMLSQMQCSFTLNIPYAVDTTNADNVSNEGRTLYWNLLSGLNGGKSIQARFTVLNMGNIAITIFIVIGLVVSVVIASINSGGRRS